MTTAYEEVDSGVREDYDLKFQEALAAMREEQESKISEVRQEVEMLYSKKVRKITQKWFKILLIINH